MKITDITDAKDIADLCGHNPADPYLEIAWETGDIQIYSEYRSTNGTSFAVYNGHRSRYQLPLVSALAVKDAVEGILPQIQAASEQYYSRWDGNNHVAAWHDVDAERKRAQAADEYAPDHHDAYQCARQTAELAIESAISDLETEPPVQYWDAGDFLGVVTPCEYGVSATTTDKEIATLAETEVVNARHEGHLLDLDDVIEFMIGQRDELAETEARQCKCGEITGMPWRRGCGYDDCDPEELVMVEFMPEYLRESHKAARNSGVWPHNGSIRARCTETCAEMIIEDHPDWARIVSDGV